MRWPHDSTKLIVEASTTLSGQIHVYCRVSLFTCDINWILHTCEGPALIALVNSYEVFFITNSMSVFEFHFSLVLSHAITNTKRYGYPSDDDNVGGQSLWR